MTITVVGGLGRRLSIAFSAIDQAFDQAVQEAYDRRGPNALAEHAYRLAQAFSKFYAACPILAPGHEATRGARLALTEAVLKQLETVLNLLGIETPSQM